MNPPDRPPKKVRFNLSNKQINREDTNEGRGYFPLINQIKADVYTMNAPSLTPSASPVSNDGSLFMPPIQELPPIHSNNHKSFKEEQEVQAKIVICPSITLRNYADWHIITDLMNSSLDLTAIY